MEQSAIGFLDAFARGERQLALPAELPIILDGVPTSVAIHSVMRLLPRKRVMLQGRIGERNVAVKLFSKSLSSGRNIGRELAGYAAVRQARAATPELIGHFVSPCGRCEGLIYQFIDDAIELGRLWPQFSSDEKKYWLGTVMSTSLALHCVGAYQQDIHLGNFLLQGSQLFLLDLGSIAVREAPLRQRECLLNLGQLIAQLDVREQALADTALENYFAHSGWIDSPPQRFDLQRAIRSAWRRRLRDYLRKATRVCSLTFFARSLRQLVAYRRGWDSEELKQFLADPDRFMAGAQLLKAGNTATVVKAEMNGRAVVIKRYNIKNWRHAIARSLRPTRAMHSWIYAHMLELIGIRGLAPIALLEHRFGPLRGKAYMVAEWIDAPDLLSRPADKLLDEKFAAALGSLLAQMKKCRLSHGDFKANNLLLDRDDIAVIDLDAMRRHRTASRFARAFGKDIERLRRNWPADTPLQKQIADITREALATS